MPTLVQKGNKIHISPHDLENNKIKIQWSQSLRTRTEEYYFAHYTVPSGGDAEGGLFVQCSKVDEFKARCSGEPFTLEVTDDFQYGQDKAQTKRFLVFHNKGNRAYQHRFAENALTQLSGTVKDVAGWFGLDQGYGGADQLAKNFVGDYLNEF
ncbi:hypothetical protein BKA63DRAFT_59185 [Paraphoma chrysanthemicola]|nr:hypothetical protein BKA63DRAFT_59185 [Paraphoma chrysanthemicola]